MRFTAELSLGTTERDESLQGPRIARLARLAEEVGFDAIGFNDHPAPSRAWLEAGGHEAFDPFVALGFAAGVTSRIRLMTFLAVVPYRNRWLLAKSLASVDALSGGRVVACVGTGYLKSEFRELGVDFDDRNALFDEALELLATEWSDDADPETQPRPRPVQRPIPLWIGGNSRLSHRRAARLGAGWSPMLVEGVVAATTRTAQMTRTGPELPAAIAELRELAAEAGRDPLSLDVQINGGGGDPTAYGTPAHLEEIERLADLGVTQVALQVDIDDTTSAEESLERYGAAVIAASTPDAPNEAQEAGKP